MLKSIHLINFQAHKDTMVEFTNGINILTGPSQIGKSCIRRAIEWCLFNNSFDGIRREGSKTTSVKIELDNETVLERIRSASINRYVLTRNGQMEVFDSIGKTMPQEVKDAIGINPIEVDGEELWLNSSPQIALPFLFDKSPTWRMKLFNKLTGNDLLDKLFVQFNKDILRIGRDHKSDTERLEDLTGQLEEKEIEKEQLEAVHKTVKNQIEALRLKQEKYDNLLKLKDLQYTNELSGNEVSLKLEAIKFPEDDVIKGLTTKTDDLDNKICLLKGVVRNKDEISKVSSELSEIVLPELDSVAIGERIDTLDMLKTVIKRQDEANVREKDILTKIADTEIELKEAKDKLNELLENTKTCSLCGQDLTLECKKQLGEF